MRKLFFALILALFSISFAVATDFGDCDDLNTGCPSTSLDCIITKSCSIPISGGTYIFNNFEIRDGATVTIAESPANLGSYSFGGCSGHNLNGVTTGGTGGDGGRSNGGAGQTGTAKDGCGSPGTGGAGGKNKGKITIIAKNVLISGKINAAGTAGEDGKPGNVGCWPIDRGAGGGGGGGGGKGGEVTIISDRIEFTGTGLIDVSGGKGGNGGDGGDDPSDGLCGWGGDCGDWGGGGGGGWGGDGGRIILNGSLINIDFYKNLKYLGGEGGRGGKGTMYDYNYCGTASRGNIGVLSINGLNAAILSDTIPSTMNPGEKRVVSIKVKNTGAKWSKLNNCGSCTSCNLNGCPYDARCYKFGEISDSGIWGIIRSEPINQDIDNDQEYTFTFQITAPTTTGAYNFNWRMIKECDERFGEIISRRIEVVSSASPPTSNVCGDRTCQAGETYSNCPSDCPPGDTTPPNVNVNLYPNTPRINEQITVIGTAQDDISNNIKSVSLFLDDFATPIHTCLPYRAYCSKTVAYADIGSGGHVYWATAKDNSDNEGSSAQKTFSILGDESLTCLEQSTRAKICNASESCAFPGIFINSSDGGNGENEGTGFPGGAKCCSSGNCVPRGALLACTNPAINGKEFDPAIAECTSLRPLPTSDPRFLCCKENPRMKASFGGFGAYWSRQVSMHVQLTGAATGDNLYCLGKDITGSNANLTIKKGNSVIVSRIITSFDNLNKVGGGTMKVAKLPFIAEETGAYTCTVIDGSNTNSATINVNEGSRNPLTMPFFGLWHMIIALGIILAYSVWRSRK